MNRSLNLSVSDKRQRKLFKRWHREQEEAKESSMVTMQDVEMAVAEGPSEDTIKTLTKFHMKKGLKLKHKHLKRKGKKSRSTSQPAAAEAAGGSMAE